MPSASGGLRPPDQGLCPWTPLGAPPPDPHIGSRCRARHILSVPVLFLTGNEPCPAPTTCAATRRARGLKLPRCWDLGLGNRSPKSKITTTPLSAANPLHVAAAYWLSIDGADGHAIVTLHSRIPHTMRPASITTALRHFDATVARAVTLSVTKWLHS